MFRKSFLLAVLLATTTLTSGLTSQIFQRSQRLTSTVQNRLNRSYQDRPQSCCDQPAQLWNFSDQAPLVSDSTTPVELPQTAEAPIVEAPQVETTETQPLTSVLQQAEVTEQVEEAQVEAPTLPGPQVAETLEAKELLLKKQAFQPLEFDAPMQVDLADVESQLSRELELEDLGTLSALRLNNEAITLEPALDAQTLRTFETPAIETEFAAAPVATVPATTKTFRRSERSRRAAAGWLPLLLLPLLGLLGWLLFGRRRESDVLVAGTSEREQRLEGSFSGPVAAAQTDHEITDLKIDAATIQAGLEESSASRSTVSTIGTGLGIKSDEKHELKILSTEEIERDRSIVGASGSEGQKRSKPTYKGNTKETTTELKVNDRERTAELKTNNRERTTELKADARKSTTELKANDRKSTTELKINDRERTTELKANDRKSTTELKVNDRERKTELNANARKSTTELKADARKSTTELKVNDRERTSELTQIEGLSAQQVACLGAAGIYTFTQFKNTKPEEIQRLFVKSGLPKCETSEVGQWFTLAEYGQRNDYAGPQNDRKEQTKLSLGETGSTVESKSTRETSASTKTTELSRGERSTVTGSTTRSSEPTDGDDLTKIRGIGPATAKLLNENGITRYKQLADVKESRLQELMENAGPQFQKIGWSTWRRQAGFAAKSDWKGLDDYYAQQKTELSSSRLVPTRSSSLDTTQVDDSSRNKNQSSSSSSVAANNASASEATGEDDLTRINGIGPASAELLRANGITRFEQLISADQRWLEDLFTNSGTQFTSVDWTTWGQQAQFASNGDWNGLRTWFLANCPSANQNRRRVGVNKGSKSKRSRRVLNKRTKSDSTSTKKTEAQSRARQSVVRSGANGSALTNDGGDDLTLINGIGPASARLLRKNGITRFEQLVSCEQSWLEGLFQNSGTQVTTWRRQAKFASTGDWDGLRQWFLTYSSSTKESQTTKTAAKSSKSNSVSAKTPAKENVRSASASDNLTVINGIGPATAKVLKANGITRFEQIAVMTESQLESIISGSGARFQLVDPKTWPQQAIDLLKSFGRCTTTELSLLSEINELQSLHCLLYTSPSPRDATLSRMPSSA